MSPSDNPERSVTLTLDLGEARRMATCALKANDWHLLDVLTKALAALGLEDPMDVYVEADKLRRRVRELEGL
jgi:hypothetical protein